MSPVGSGGLRIYYDNAWPRCRACDHMVDSYGSFCRKCREKQKKQEEL
ncbi:MAG: hypothetical protein A4E65_02208 [Syntrophorhabdus sp. PtaU1.Bin153]|nr:MAG: hypothetical protein A4E65_02208 [Syntrophorhabdus sp. PtaU1.Bin153]